MCGIVGLFLKNPALQPELGKHVETMLIGMTDRGPDSAGIAVYHSPVAGERCKLTLFNADTSYPWRALAGELGTDLNIEIDAEQRGNHALLTASATEADVIRWLKAKHPDVRIMGYGKLMEVYKDMGLPVDVAKRYGLAGMQGSHAIGHTRMATESAVTTEHSHPFTPAPDMCLVHNGSLSNHNNLRKWLRRHGQEFDTDNDSEVAARYFAHRLAEGATLNEALEAGLVDLDGFFTFTMGTKDGFAVLRDGVACKPAVLAENDDWVAMASEFRSLAYLPNIEKAKIWEPAPATVYSWSLH
ncbi:glutamine amidotransferase family protein [Dongia sp.]|uniref:class II glutamine amidotransferase n=1 Tax=Dongia sp. TaxID=1977262 RepID=UPI0035B28AFB